MKENGFQGQSVKSFRLILWKNIREKNGIEMSSPDYILILAWNFFEAIKNSNKKLEENGLVISGENTELNLVEMIEIKRYSAEYFRLARDLGTDASHYLALEGTVTVVIQGQAYQLKD